MSKYKDFDAALAERAPDPDSKALDFVFGGEQFRAPLPLAAGPLFSFITDGIGVRGMRYLAMQIDFLAGVVADDPDGKLAAAVTEAEATVTTAGAAGDPKALVAAEQALTDVKAAQILQSGSRRMRAAIKASKADSDFLDDMCRWMIEGATESPLTESESSSSEPQQTGDGSKVDSTSNELTSSDSAHAAP